MPVKVERGNRVFPVSDKSSDVIFALQRALKEKKVEVLLHTEVSKLCYEKITDTRADEEASDKKPELKITGVILRIAPKWMLMQSLLPQEDFHIRLQVLQVTATKWQRMQVIL